jgi:WD40 repeat protein
VGFARANFSPDGQNVITWNRDEGEAKIWAVHATDSQVVSEEEARICTSMPSPNGERLLTFDDAETKVYETRSSKPLFTLPEGDGGWSPDGGRICISSRVSSADRSKSIVRVYDAQSGQLLHELEGVRTTGTDYCFNADGSQILTVKDEDGSVNVWDTKTGQTWVLATPVWSGSLTFEGSYNLDGTRIFIGKWEEQNSEMTGISILDAETRQPIAELETDGLNVISSTFSRDGRLFVGLLANWQSHQTPECRIWDATTGELLPPFPVDVRFNASLEISPEGSRILVIELGELHLIDAHSGDELLGLPIDGVRTAKFDRDGNKIIGIIGGLSRTFRVGDGDEVRVLDGTPVPELKK